MRNLRFWLLTLMAVSLTGCGKASTVVHGKPVSHWVEALRGPDAKERKRAVEALGNVGAADPDVVPALVGAVKDRDPAVRAAAVLALLKIGPDAHEAVPVLTAARGDPNAHVRRYAAKALARIQQDPEEGSQ
jgi:HEAT repeat protein